MELNERLAFGPRRVFHAGGPVTEGASREFFRAAAIERFSSREIQVPEITVSRSVFGWVCGGT